MGASLPESSICDSDSEELPSCLEPCVSLPLPLRPLPDLLDPLGPSGRPLPLAQRGPWLECLWCLCLAELGVGPPSSMSGDSGGGTGARLRAIMEQVPRHGPRGRTAHGCHPENSSGSWPCPHTRLACGGEILAQPADEDAKVQGGKVCSRLATGQEEARRRPGGGREEAGRSSALRSADSLASRALGELPATGRPESSLHI